MNTAPIINVNNVVSSIATATKVNAQANSSDQSFGQVLSREVGDRNNASGDANNGQTGQTSSAAANAPNAPNSSNGKGVKTKSNTDSSQADNSSSKTTSDVQNGNQGQLTQMLALVANVPSGAPVSSALSSAANAGSPIGAIVDKLAIDRTVGADKAAALPIASAVLPSGTADDEIPITATDAQSNPTIEATQATMDTVLKTTTPNTSTEQMLNKNGAEIGNTQQNPNTLSSQINATEKSALDLNAESEKNIQSGLAALNSSAVKVDQAIQTTPTITATAMPSIAMGQALPNNPDDKLTPQVGSAGWDQAVGQKVVWMVAGGQQNASLTLNPPDLGPMQVVLNVTNSHATVTFTSSQPEVRQALESAIPKLREMLGDAGIQLGQASINSGSAQQQTFSQQSSQNTHSVKSSGESNDITVSTIRTLPSSAGQGLVDTFA